MERARDAYSFILRRYELAKPRNFWTSLTDVGLGQSRIVEAQAGSIWNPWVVTTGRGMLVTEELAFIGFDVYVIADEYLEDCLDLFIVFARVV